MCSDVTAATDVTHNLKSEISCHIYVEQPSKMIVLVWYQCYAFCQHYLKINYNNVFALSCSDMMHKYSKCLVSQTWLASLSQVTCDIKCANLCTQIFATFWYFWNIVKQNSVSRYRNKKTKRRFSCA